MSPKSTDREVVKAKIASWIRKNTSKKGQWFFATRTLFDGIGMNYDNKMDYRVVMDIIHQWRRQAPFFYEAMVQEGELSGKTIYKDFEQFLKDWNSTGAYFLWKKNIVTKEGTIVFGYYQPMTVEAKIQIDTKRNGRCINQLKNRLAEMMQMNTPLPSGFTPELALASVERFETKYLLPEGDK